MPVSVIHTLFTTNKNKLIKDKLGEREEGVTGCRESWEKKERQREQQGECGRQREMERGMTCSLCRLRGERRHNQT